MTYSEATTLRAAIEAALLSGAGVQSVSIGDRTISWSSSEDARRILSQLNRDIAAYENRLVNRNPNIVRPKWN